MLPHGKRMNLFPKAKLRTTEGCYKEAFFVSLNIRKIFLSIRGVKQWDRLHWGQRKCWGQDFQDYHQDNSPMDEKLTTSSLWPFPTLCLNVREKDKCDRWAECPLVNSWPNCICFFFLQFLFIWGSYTCVNELGHFWDEVGTMHPSRN